MRVTPDLTRLEFRYLDQLYKIDCFYPLH